MTGLADLLQDECINFYQAVFAIEQQLGCDHKNWHGVGRDSFPAQELIRFKSVQNLGFPGSPVSSIKRQPDSSGHSLAFDFFVSFLGLTGPSGVLPMHYSELVLERLKQKDPTMRDFFDLFNHRITSLFYRAWEKYRFACQYLYAEDNKDPFSQVLKYLTGQETDLSLFYGGFFSRPIRSAQLISLQLSHLLRAEVEVTPLNGRWIYLTQHEQSQMADTRQPFGQYAQLGHSTVLGSKVWDVSSMVVVNIEAEPAAIRSLLPGHSGYLRLQQLINNFLEPAIQCRVCLKAKVIDFPGIGLDGRSQLGMSGVLLAAKSRSLHTTYVSFRLARTHEH